MNGKVVPGIALAQIIRLPAEPEPNPRASPVAPPAKKVDWDVLAAWKMTAQQYVRDPCLCAAIALVLARYSTPALEQALRRALPKGRLKKEIAPAVLREIRQARWGDEDELTHPSSGEPLPGMLKIPCTEQKDSDCILINRRMHPAVDTWGDERRLRIGLAERAKVALRATVLPHEAIHKFFRLIGITDDHFAGEVGDERIVREIIAVYFRALEGRPVDGAEIGIPALTEACGELGPCAMQLTNEPGGKRMSPRVPEVGQKVVPDFNNDGIQDFVGGAIWGETIEDAQGNRPHYMMDLEGVPYLQGEKPTTSYWMAPYEEQCKPPGLKKGQTVWDLVDGEYRAWRYPFMRFYTSDRLMGFVPGQKTQLRAGGEPKTIDRIIVVYDPIAQQQVPPVYADLGACRFAPIEDLVWVTTTGEPFDMRRAVAMANKPEPLTEQGNAPEDHAAVLIRETRALLAKIPLEQSPAARRDHVLTFLQTSPLDDPFPEGWERSLLFLFGLPQPETRYVPLLECPRGPATSSQSNE